MKTNNEINKIIRNAIEALLGNPNDYIVAQADQNAPRPSGPFCTVKVLNIMQVSEEESHRVAISDTQVEVTYQGMRKALVSVNFYKSDDSEYGDPIYMASKVRTGLITPLALDVLSAGNLGLLRRDNIKNLTEKLENGFEDRASFTVSFSMVDSFVQTIDTITGSTIHGEIEYPTRTEDITIEIN